MFKGYGAVSSGILVIFLCLFIVTAFVGLGVKEKLPQAQFNAIRGEIGVLCVLSLFSTLLFTFFCIGYSDNVYKARQNAKDLKMILDYLGSGPFLKERQYCAFRLKESCDRQLEYQKKLKEQGYDSEDELLVQFRQSQDAIEGLKKNYLRWADLMERLLGLSKPKFFKDDLVQQGQPSGSDVLDKDF